MNKKLKPCPFCGSEAITQDGLRCWCGSGKRNCPGYPSSVIKKWNRRPTEDFLNGRIRAARRTIISAMKQEGVPHNVRDILNKALRQLPEEWI